MRDDREHAGGHPDDHHEIERQLAEIDTPPFNLRPDNTVESLADAAFSAPLVRIGEGKVRYFDASEIQRELPDGSRRITKRQPA
jgi:hypothetical protein